MSKDYKDVIEMGICTKESALAAHIGCNFYPPHPPYVKVSMLKGFKQYWKGEIDIEELADKCYLRSVDGLYQYFGEFLEMEDE